MGLRSSVDKSFYLWGSLVVSLAAGSGRETLSQGVSKAESNRAGHVMSSSGLCMYVCVCTRVHMHIHM